ncbi:hypothetical protein F5146DRAFT_1018705 [Armillaria mellea]|nr:hypothetical protein F5146DRAFT_1018705 [Armillaria mellea]
MLFSLPCVLFLSASAYAANVRRQDATGAATDTIVGTDTAVAGTDTAAAGTAYRSRDRHLGGNRHRPSVASGGTADALTTDITGLSSAAASALSGAGISNTASAVSAASSVLSQATSSRAASSSARSSSAAASGSSAAASASSSAFNAAVAGHSVSSSMLVGLTTVTAGLLTGAWATFF